MGGGAGGAVSKRPGEPSKQTAVQWAVWERTRVTATLLTTTAQIGAIVWNPSCGYLLALSNRVTLGKSPCPWESIFSQVWEEECHPDTPRRSKSSSNSI